MSAWTGFLDFIDGLGHAVTTFFTNPIEGLTDLFSPSNYEGNIGPRIGGSSVNIYHPSVSSLNKARARANANVERYTNEYDNYDDKLQNYLSNIDEDKEELEQGDDNIYTSPAAADAYDSLVHYKTKLDGMRKQLNAISKKLNSATYASSYFGGAYNQAVNAKNRASNELDQGIGTVAGMIPMLFM